MSREPLPTPPLPAFDQDGWDGQMWLGWLSGFWVFGPSPSGEFELYHRCGWSRDLDTSLLGNIVIDALRHCRTGCLAHRHTDADNPYAPAATGADSAAEAAADIGDGIAMTGGDARSFADWSGVVCVLPGSTETGS